jgi:hypothetical protein
MFFIQWTLSIIKVKFNATEEKKVDNLLIIRNKHYVMKCYFSYFLN